MADLGRLAGPTVDLAAEIRAFAAYLNAPRNHFDAGEQALLDEDLIKARAAMEVAWLERLAAGRKTPERRTVTAGTLPPMFDPVIGWTTSDGVW